jgi:parallel beta-helix repeat protein
MNSRVFSVPSVFVVALALVALAMPAGAAGPGNVLTVGPGRHYVTIQAAVDAARPGSRILVYPGTYHEEVSVAVNNLQILAQGEDVVVVPSHMHTGGFQVHADHVTIQGFEIAFGRNCASGIRFEGSHNTFADNYIYLDGTCLGVNALVCRDHDGGSDDNVIERNTVFHSDLGIVIVAETPDAINTGNIIRDNTILHVDQTPIAVANGRGFLVSGNRIDGAPDGICIAVGTLGPNHVAQGFHTVVKNTMGKCVGNGISVYAWPGTVLTHNRIAENTVQDCVGDCLALEAGAGATLTHNQVISNSVSFSLEANGVLLAADAGADVSDNLIMGNLVYRNALNGIYVTSGADRNRILNNEVQDNNEVGIAVAGDDNLIAGNSVHDNTLNLSDLGQGNRWRNNTATLSVGWAIGWDETNAPAIVHTADGGLTWQAQGDLSAWASLSGMGDISAVDDQTAWAALPSNGIGGAILHTTDGGATWVSQTIPAGLALGIKGVKGLSRDEAWAASGGGTMLHTTDGGATWNVIPHPTVPITQVNRIDAIASGDVWIANVDNTSGVNASLIHSTDAGLTWRLEPLPDVLEGAGPLAISAFSPLVAWSATAAQGNLYRTLDGGAQWLNVAPSAGTTNDFDDICAAGTEAVWGVQNHDLSGTIYRVHVAGEGSVDSQTFDPTEAVYSFEGVTCLDDRIAWVVGLQWIDRYPDLPIGVTLSTVDGGESWVQGTGPTDIRYWKVSFVGARR